METPNHGYNAPDEGTADWHKPLNENFKAFDTDVEIRDELGARSEYRPKEGAKFLATDTGQTFLGRGDRWEEIPAGAKAQSLPNVEVATSAAEIQPAIDALAANVDSAGAGGGIVQLAARTYYPTTTIWLKSGVTLQGARRSRHTNVIRGGESPTFSDTDGVHPKRSTVISTRDMAEGADVYTLEHDTVDPHPHFPVVANYHAGTVEDGSVRDRDPSEDELRNWGVDVGLRNVIIRADKTRWWDFDEHGRDDVYNGSKTVSDAEMTDRKWATYFGVYDALIIQYSRNVLTENVETRGFLGYGGFWEDVRQAVDRGGRYEGGATDYHGSAYHLAADKNLTNTTIGGEGGSNVYTTGKWVFEAVGPTPTVQFEGHVDNSFESGGWNPTNNVTGERPSFLGDEETYREGQAPLTNPNRETSVLVDGDQRTSLETLGISTVGNDRWGTGLDIADSHATYKDVSVGGCDVGVSTGGRNSYLREIQVSNCTTAVDVGNSVPHMSDVVVTGCDLGFACGNAWPHGSINTVSFDRDCGTAIKDAGASNKDREFAFNGVWFGGVEGFGENFSSLRVTAPSGYGHLSDFPEEYTP